MKQARIKLLQSMPIFGGITEQTLEFLIDRATILKLSPGEYFFRESDHAVSMFVIERGKVAVSKQWNGEDHLLKYLSDGDCFGEMALLDLYPRSASVMAVDACDVIEIAHATLLELYKHDIEQFAMIEMNIGREISRRLRTADNQLFQSRFSSR